MYIHGSCVAEACDETLLFGSKQLSSLNVVGFVQEGE